MTSAPGKRLSPKRFFGIQIAIFLPLVTVLSIASLRSILRRFLDSADVVRLVHNDFRGERVRDVIRISPLSKTSSLFFTAAIFQRPFFFLPRCSSNRFRPILSDPSFLIDRETRLLLYLLRLSPSLSLCVSSVKFEKRCANLSIDRNLDKVRHQAKRSYRFLDISRAISRAWSRSARETQRFVDSFRSTFFSRVFHR